MTDTTTSSASQALAGTSQSRAYRGIVEYDPAELVITARCGTPLAEIEDAVAQSARCWPSSRRISRCAARPARPRSAARWRPGCPARASVGGAARLRAGRAIDGRPRRDLNFGQVMKNVAGYDVSRLLAGSLGTLGLISRSR
jgi:glycolate oxidase FAD binding subunit